MSDYRDDGPWANAPAVPETRSLVEPVRLVPGAAEKIKELESKLKADLAAIRTAPTAPGGGVEAREIERRKYWAIWSRTAPMSHAPDSQYPTREAAGISLAYMQERGWRADAKVVECETIVRDPKP